MQISELRILFFAVVNGHYNVATVLGGYRTTAAQNPHKIIEVTLLQENHIQFKFINFLNMLEMIFYMISLCIDLKYFKYCKW